MKRMSLLITFALLAAFLTLAGFRTSTTSAASVTVPSTDGEFGRRHNRNLNFAGTAVAAIAAAPNRAPALSAPAPAPATTAVNPTAPVAATAPVSTAAARTAYINAMYVAVVPAAERSAMAGDYVLGYNLAGLNCGTGCTGISNGQARSSFNDAFFSSSLAYQRNTLAHEAAHAYGYLHFNGYGLQSWAALGGWQAQFNALDRSFVGTYDAEAWASCVAWQETGFNNRVNQITSVCTAPAAALAMAQIR